MNSEAPPKKKTAYTVPELTFPEAEQALVRDLYGKANCVLEYGSGGSTVLGLDLKVPHLITVESDKAWLRNIRRLVRDREPETQVDLFHVNIGPTKKWGSPTDNRKWAAYYQYPLTVWDQDFFEHPDVVLIDGRFRAACLITTLMRATRPVVAMFDDYAERDYYHRVEEFVKPARMVGRIAVFELEPWTFDPARATELIGTFFRVR